MAAPKKSRAQPKPTRQAAVPPVREAPGPIDRAVDKLFSNDLAIRSALKRNLAERGQESLQTAEQAKAAFAAFKPSSLSDEERTKRHVVGWGENVEPTTRRVLDKAVTTMRTAVAGRSVKVDLAGIPPDLVMPGRGRAAAGRIALADLLGLIGQRASGPVESTYDIAINACRAKREADQVLGAILGETPAENPGTTPPTPEPKITAVETKAYVNAQVQNQMATATAPEMTLRYDVAARATADDTGTTIETFELRTGPADVTSYHDFNHLQIAFEHVWSEIFDDRLARLGEELYHEYVKLQDFLGVPAGDRTVGTIDDLKRLMDEVRELGRLTGDVTPGPLKPADGDGSSTAPSAPTTADAVIDAVQTVLDPGSVVTNAIGDETVGAILNPGGALIGAIADALRGVPQIRWAAFPGPLPSNGDIIQATVEDAAVAEGAVEILLTTAPGTHGWKGVKVTSFDADNKPTSWWIANDPTDKGVWNPASYNRLPIYAGEAATAVLEFWHEGLWRVHTACYVLTNIGEVLTNRRRVTFHWLKD